MQNIHNKIVMKRRVLIFFMMFISVIRVSAQSCGTFWWNNEFVIGTTVDPPVKYVYNNSVKENNVNLAREAGFNFFSGEQTSHRNGPTWRRFLMAKDYNFIKKKYPESRVLFMQWLLNNPDEVAGYSNPDNIEDFIDSLWIERLDTFDLARICELDGLYVVDEPRDSDRVAKGYLACIDFLKKVLCNNRLFFINLYPCYVYDVQDAIEQKKYQDYLRKFLYPGTPLQVACFDNYFHTSYFETSPVGDGGYYYNLALMRHIADTANVPLWSYINTCEPRYITGRDSLWQASSMRLAAFAPLAYGAKGLMYYTYDSRHPNQVRAKLRNASGGMSDGVYYMHLPTDTTENVFLGHLRDGSKTDIAVKRDTNLGDWYIKLSDNIMTDSIDCTLGWYGHRSSILPFLCYRPDLERDVIAGLYQDGRLFMTDTLSGWTHNITLPELQQSWWQQLTDKKVSSFSHDSVSLDFCIAKPDTGRDTLFIYNNLQMSPANYTHSTPQKIALEQGEHVIQLVRDEGNLYAVTRWYTRIFQNDIIINRLHRIYKSGNNYTTQHINIFFPESKTPDHFWVEQTDALRLYMQPLAPNQNDKIYAGVVNWGNNNMSMEETDYMNPPVLYYVTGLRRYGTQIYDRFGIWEKRSNEDALIDGLGNPTIRYHMARQNNLYIRDVLSPIILGATWKGAWHTPYKEHPHAIEFMHRSDTIGGYVKMLDAVSDSLLKGMDYNMIAGKFETDSCYYYFFVDKGGEAYTDCSIRLNDDGISSGTRRVEALTSLSGEPRQLTSHQNNDGTVTFTWDSMLGGELVPIKIMK